MVLKLNGVFSICLENARGECIIVRDERANKDYMKRRRKVVIDLMQKKISKMKELLLIVFPYVQIMKVKGIILWGIFMVAF